jgi:hypothetical protein
VIDNVTQGNSYSLAFFAVRSGLLQATPFWGYFWGYRVAYSGVIAFERSFNGMSVSLRRDTIEAKQKAVRLIADAKGIAAMPLGSGVVD